MFERFYRSTSARAMPGSGLGLAIVKQVVVKHGGTLRVEDTVPGGQPPGTSIHVVLPGRPLPATRTCRHGRAGGQRRQWLIGSALMGEESLGMSRMFSKWILSPAWAPLSLHPSLFQMSAPTPGRARSDMTNHPRYSPPPPQPGHRPGGHEQHAAPGYPGAHRTVPAARRSSSRTTGATRPSSSSARPTTRTAALRSSQLACRSRRAPQKRSRAGALTAGAVAVAIVSAGIGGGVALLVQPDRPAASSSVTGLAPSVPAASLPAGSVEQVAAKVVPSVVKLEVDLGQAVRRGLRASSCRPTA